jgi:two-component system OmpR family response regulator/two-component system phosphate regulon response regulator OmpR
MSSENQKELILIVDDDPRLQELLLEYLGEQGYVVSSASNGGDIPIIMLSARGEEWDRIIGLEVGADDYLAKPFNPRELLARIRAVLRRGFQTATTDAEGSEKNIAPDSQQDSKPGHLSVFGEYTLDLEGRILWKDGNEVTLTSGEMALLIVLVEHPNRVLSRDQLMDMINAGEHDPFDRSIDVRITRLRHKIENDNAKPRFIRTIWGEGYRFTPDTNPGL